MPTKKGRRRPSLRERDESAWSFSLSGEFHREIDRGDHAISPRNVFAGDVEGRSMIGACAREGKTERYVYAFVKGVQLQRNQSLVVINAKHGVPGAVRGVIKNGVGGKRTGDFGFWILDFGLQLLHGWFDQLGFLPTERA